MPDGRFPCNGVLIIRLAASLHCGVGRRCRKQCRFKAFSRSNGYRASPSKPLPRASVILLDNLIMKRHVLIFGLVGGFLIAILQYSEYRFVVIEHSVEIYTALVAILFAIFGIWL